MGGDLDVKFKQARCYPNKNKSWYVLLSLLYLFFPFLSFRDLGGQHHCTGWNHYVYQKINLSMCC